MPWFTWWDQETSGAPVAGAGTGTRLTDRVVTAPVLTDRAIVGGAMLTDRAELGATLTLLVEED